MKPGEIYWVDLATGRRPSTVVSRESVNQGNYYPGNQDPHKSLQPIRSSNSQSRLPRDQRSTTESTEIHGKENPNQLPLSVLLTFDLFARRADCQDR